MTSTFLPSLINYRVGELKKEFSRVGLEPYRAAQVLGWIYKKGVYDVARMTDLSEASRRLIGEHFATHPGEITLKKDSREDQSVKLLIRLADGETVETVFMQRGNRRTVCVSTQVGCKFKCSFCASGQLGFLRNLTSGEILAQVLRARDLSDKGRITHIVFMGIGEPLDNFDNLVRTIDCLHDPELLHLGARKITVSTSGVVPKILELARRDVKVELSVSLHAPNDAIRSQIMPINRRYPIGELLPVCSEYTALTKREITYEYILAKGLNASVENARELASLLKKRRCKINLIPLNPIAEFPYERPTYREIRAFQEILEKSGITATVRFSRGVDIDAACGQLRSNIIRSGKGVSS